MQTTEAGMNGSTTQEAQSGKKGIFSSALDVWNSLPTEAQRLIIGAGIVGAVGGFTEYRRRHQLHPDTSLTDTLYHATDPENLSTNAGHIVRRASDVVDHNIQNAGTRMHDVVDAVTERARNMAVLKFNKLRDRFGLWPSEMQSDEGNTSTDPVVQKAEYQPTSLAAQQADPWDDTDVPDTSNAQMPRQRLHDYGIKYV